MILVYQVFCTLVLIGLVSAFDIEETSVDIEYALIESPLSSIATMTANMTTAVLSSCATSLHISQLLAAAFLSLFMFLLT